MINHTSLYNNHLYAIENNFDLRYFNIYIYFYFLLYYLLGGLSILTIFTRECAFHVMRKLYYYL